MWVMAMVGSVAHGRTEPSVVTATGPLPERDTVGSLTRS